MWVETDLEPDDVLALMMLKNIDYYVVGEGNADIKYDRMIRYCELLGNKGAIVIKGQNSDKLFENDGKEFDVLENKICIEDYLHNFMKFASMKDPIMFSLKPMRELLTEYRKDPVLIKQFTKNIELYVYGGFNFRCILKTHEKELLELLNSFKKVHIYESFYVSGEFNSINKTNFPKLYQYIMEHAAEPSYQTLLKLTYNWNDYLYHDISKWIDTVQKDSDIYKRNMKIMKDIQDNMTFQYVLADFGLTAIYQTIESTPVTNLRFEKSYTKFDETDKETNIYVYKQIPNSSIEHLIIKSLQK